MKTKGYETRTDLPDNYWQKSKDDWWKCSHCGKFHKGFPYRCPEENEELK